jgi:hypothetical protein
LLTYLTIIILWTVNTCGANPFTWAGLAGAAGTTEILTVQLTADKVGGTVPKVTAVSDTYSAADAIAWTLASQNFVSVPATTLGYDQEVWYIPLVASHTGVDTFTITTSGNFAVCMLEIDYANTIEYAQTAAQNTYQQNVALTPISLSVTSATLSVPPNSLVFLSEQISGGTFTNSPSSSYSAGTNNALTNTPAPLVQTPYTAGGNTCSALSAGAAPYCFIGLADAYTYVSTATSTSYTTVISIGATTPGDAMPWGYSLTWVIFNPAPVGVTTQSQSIGSCPPGGGSGVGHYALTNTTQFWYSGNALGQEVVNTIQTEVQSIKGSGSHTLNLAVFGTAGSLSNGQSPNVANPASLLYLKSFTITSGTVNQTITVQINIPLNSANTLPLPFNFWAISISGDDHIIVAASTTSGMTTQSGLPTASSSFTSSGTSSVDKMALCATGSYQSVITGPTTTTVSTQSATSTMLTTSTFTVSTIGANLFNSSSNWPVIFFILLIPAGLFMGITKNLSGALVGLMIGAIVGLLMGVLPPFVFIGLVIALASVAFMTRSKTD